MLTFLWTDVAVFSLVIAGMYAAWTSSKKEHLRRPWRQAFAVYSYRCIGFSTCTAP